MKTTEFVRALEQLNANPDIRIYFATSFDPRVAWESCYDAQVMNDLLYMTNLCGVETRRAWKIYVDDLEVNHVAYASVCFCQCIRDLITFSQVENRVLLLTMFERTDLDSWEEGYCAGFLFPSNLFYADTLDEFNSDGVIEGQLDRNVT